MPATPLHDPLLHDRPTGAPARPAAPSARPGPPASSVHDPRLARLAARSAARRQELGVAPAHSAPGVPRAGAPGLPPPPPGSRPVAASPAPRPAARPSRRHAAKGSRTAALVLSVGTTIALSGWFKVEQGAQAVSIDSTTTGATAAGSGSAAASTTTGAAGAVAVTATVGTAATSAADTTAAARTTTAATAAATTATPATTAAVATTTGLADGTYTGAADSNRWGTVQVQISVSGGSISDVQILQYPNGDNKSVNINRRALPVLVQETLTAQSSNIDTVSGATYTSGSYLVSLQSAIDAARAAVAG